MSDIALNIGGLRHQGWESIRLTRSIENVASGFDLTLSDRWRGVDRPTIVSGQACTVSLDNELLITGYSGAVLPNYAANSHGLQVQGRSKTGDLVDCSLIGREFKNLTLTMIATRLCAPFGISVMALVDTGAPFKVARLATGQPIFEFLEQLARIRAVRLMTTPEGHLYIVNAGTRFADVALEYGENIKDASGRSDLNQSFSEYTVVAQQDGLSLNPAAQADVNGTATDSRVKRYRPIAIETDGPADIAATRGRAQWEMNTRFGRGNEMTYTVAGWRQTPNGRTWQPNEQVRIVDPVARINKTWLITQTVLIKDDQGSRTEITVKPRAAFDLIPLPDPNEGGGVFG